MDRVSLLFFLSLLLVATASPRLFAIDSGAKKSAQTATFEFLAPGNSMDPDSLTGTAFAIGFNEYVTTAHLIGSVIGSHYQRPRLVNANREEFPIADLLQYSERRNYAVFSVKNPPSSPTLSLQTNAHMANDWYFAGWNATKGVVIRPATPVIQVVGESAADIGWLQLSDPVWSEAEGGPLFDASGHVVGVLSTSRATRRTNLASVVDARLSGARGSAVIQLPEEREWIMPTVWSFESPEAEISLPTPFDQFAAELQTLRDAYFDRVITPLLDATRNNFVLVGPAAPSICALLNGHYCQCKPQSSATGFVATDKSVTNEILHHILKGEDSSRTITIAGVVLLHTRKHSSATLQENSAPDNAYFDRSSVQNRQASLHTGTPKMLGQKAYIDFQGRTWTVEAGPSGHHDISLITMGRELSDGYMTLTRQFPTSLRRAAELQVQFVANLVNYGCGTSLGDPVAQVAYEFPHSHALTAELTETK